MNRIIALVIIVVSFFSCQEEIGDLGYISGDHGIRFAVDSVSTRGSVITNDNITSMEIFCHTSVGIFDGTTIPNHMYKTEVQYINSSDLWVIQPATGDAISNASWDGNLYHSFFAFAPYEINDNANTSFSSPSTLGAPLLSYTTPEILADQKDLLYSSHIDAINYHIGNNPVDFKFDHALSKITFSAGSTQTDLVTIKSFQFSNIWNMATFNFEEDINGDFMGNWEYTESGAQDNSMETSIVNGGLNNIPLTTTMSNITLADGALMLIPQNFAASSTMTVVMDITTNTTIDGNPSTSTREYKKNFSLADVSPAGWKIGKSYHYRFIYDGTGMVEVVTTDWNEEIIDGDIPGTYLDVVNKEYTTDGQIRIYYSTNIPDAIAWTGNVSGTITHTAGTGYLEYTSNAVGIDSITITAGHLSRTISLESLGIDPGTITPIPFTGNTYVGAFWKASETEERLIDMNQLNNTMPWTAKVVWVDERWNTGDIVLDTNYPSSFPVGGVASTNLNSTLSSVSGSGDIKFRIGLKSTYTPTLLYPARYALVLVESDANKQFIYLRQGENPDYLMQQGEPDKNGNPIADNRSYSRKFAAYNLTAVDIKNGTATGGTTATNNAQHPKLDANEEAVFVDYPTQAGVYWQHMISTSQFGTYGRKAYHPTNSATGALSSWNNGYTFSEYWNTLEATQKVSPENLNLNSLVYNFRRPTDGTISGTNGSGPISSSEMRQSLWTTPTSGTGNINAENLVWGYYADGFFDRRTITASVDAVAYPNSTVEKNTKDVAYMGNLFFNPNTYASIFFPASGYREYQNGALSEAGSGGGYWTSTVYNTTANGWCFYSHSGGAAEYGAARTYGFAIRPVVDE